MERIGQRDLPESISHLGRQSVGRVQSMSVSVNDLTTVNFGGTFVMTEGQVLLLTIAFVILITLITNTTIGVFI